MAVAVSLSLAALHYRKLCTFGRGYMYEIKLFHAEIKSFQCERILFHFISYNVTRSEIKLSRSGDLNTYENIHELTLLS